MVVKIELVGKELKVVHPSHVPFGVDSNNLQESGPEYLEGGVKKKHRLKISQMWIADCGIRIIKSWIWIMGFGI
jgi:hypothetical protein